MTVAQLADIYRAISADLSRQRKMRRFGWVFRFFTPFFTH